MILPDEGADRILPEAFGDQPKTVPLVIYDKDGKRHVVGKATITPEADGLRIDGNVTDPEMKELVSKTVEGLGAITNPKFEE